MEGVDIATMKGEKPELNIPICPICGKPLAGVTECYSTIGVDYKFNGKKYVMVNPPTEEQIKIVCNNCKKPLPDNFVTDNILKLLPNPIG